MENINHIYLCKPGGIRMGAINGVDENTANLKQNAADTWELSFEVQRYIANDDDFVETNYYQSLTEMMELFLDIPEGSAYFQIDAEPAIVGDGISEKKTIIAHSIECELSTKFLRQFKVNCGTKDSQEYLVGYYQNGEFVNLNLNPYTNLPIDYIVVKNKYAQQLAEVRDYLNGVDMNIDPATGLVQNYDLYPYLYELYGKYPRISSDTYYHEPTEEDNNTIGCKCYLAVVTNNVENEYGYNVLVGGESDHTKTYLINGINSLIDYYNTYSKQLSLVDLALEKGNAAGWSVGEIPDSIAGKKFNFSIDQQQDILSFFRSKCTSTMKVLFDFDRFNRQVYIEDIANNDLEHDTGVLLSYRTLVNTVNVKTSSQEGMRTKYYPKGANNLGILYANFGDDYIINLDYLINKINEYDENQYVQKDLHDKYNKWLEYKYSMPYDVALITNNIVNFSIQSDNDGATFFRNNSDTYNKIVIQDNGVTTTYQAYRYNGEYNILPLTKYPLYFTNKYAKFFSIQDYLLTQYGTLWYCTEYEIRREENYAEFTLMYIGNARMPASAHYNDAQNVINERSHTIYDNRREAYMALSKQYNQYMIDIDAIKNKLPNDGCSIDYTTFTFDELNISYTAYVNALSTLITLYMTDVGAVTFDQDTLEAKDASGNNCTSIKDTFYYPDFICYKDTIIPNVMKALAMYVQTADDTCTLNPNDPNQYDVETGKWIEAPGGNTWYRGNAKRIKDNMSEAYLYDMDLYGTVELEAKINAWKEVAMTLYKVGFVLNINGSVEDPIPEYYKYNTPNDAGWNRVVSYCSQHNISNPFVSKESFFRLLNEYLDYVSTDVRDNSLTKAGTKGVITLAQEKIEVLQPSIDVIINKQNEVQSKRKEIARDVAMTTWSYTEGDVTYSFTDDDIENLQKLIRESEYVNNNILTTNLDDIATTVDVQEELYQDAVTALSEKAQPQLSFDIDVDNLFAIEECKKMAEQVKLLNFIRISIGLYKDEYVKLRIVSIERNPLIPDTQLKLSFSNMTYSLSGVSDLAYLLAGDSSGNASVSGGGSSSSSGGGTYGTNDAEIQISNNMLNALLQSKTATSGVTQVMINQIASDVSSQNNMMQTGLFSKLESGDMKVSGACITDYIKSSNYNGSIIHPLDNTEGSYINLIDGTTNIGGGRIVYDETGNLKIKVSELKIDGFDQDVATAITEAQQTAEDAEETAENAAAAASDAAKTATNYLSFSAYNGLIVAQNAQSISNAYNTQIIGSGINFRRGTNIYSQVTTDGLKIFDGSGVAEANTLASFGQIAIIGKTSGFHTYIDSDSIKMKQGSDVLMEIKGQEILADGYPIVSKNMMGNLSYQQFITRSQILFLSITLNSDKIYEGSRTIKYDFTNSQYYINDKRVRGLVPIGLCGTHVTSSELNIENVYIFKSETDDKYSATIGYRVRGYKSTTVYNEQGAIYILCIVDYYENDPIEEYTGEEEMDVFG